MVRTVLVFFTEVLLYLINGKSEHRNIKDYKVRVEVRVFGGVSRIVIMRKCNHFVVRISSPPSEHTPENTFLNG